MSNIAPARNYIQIEGARFRSAVSESLIQSIGGSINALLASNLQFVDFTFSQNWTVPDGIITVWALGTGGGGGGGDGGSFGPSVDTFGGGGGGGAPYQEWIMHVTPFAIMPVVIGGGGANNTPGGSTTFNGYVWRGGGAGGPGYSLPSLGGTQQDNGGQVPAANEAKGGKGGASHYIPYPVGPGYSTAFWNGGSPGGQFGGGGSGSGGGGGGGGAGYWGPGADGGHGSTGGGGTGGNTAAANTGAGGGGGGGAISAGAGPGGSGGSGFLRLVYWG